LVLCSPAENLHAMDQEYDDPIMDTAAGFTDQVLQHFEVVIDNQKPKRHFCQ